MNSIKLAEENVKASFLKKNPEFIGSGQLQMAIGLLKIISIIT